MQHAERVFDGFIVRADDRDPFPADAIAVAVLAEKHAVAEALFHAGDLGRQMKNSRREEQSFGPVGFLFAFQNEDRVPG